MGESNRNTSCSWKQHQDLFKIAIYFLLSRPPDLRYFGRPISVLVLFYKVISRKNTHKIFVHKNEQEFLTIWVGMMRQEKNKIAWRSSNVMKLTLPQDSDQQISLNWRNVWIFFFECKVSAVQFLHKIMDSWLQTILLTYKRLLIASVKSELLRTRSV